MRQVFLWFFLIVLAANVTAEVRTLAEFYPRLDQAASVLKAEADLQAQRSDLLAKESQQGWEMFGGVSAGYQKSPFAREPFGRYVDPTARIGLRYPLLGSAEKQQRVVEDASTQVRIEHIRLDWSRRLAQLFLEENYAAYWGGQRMLALNDAYAGLREVMEGVLSRRREAGLLLESDRFEFLSNFEQADYARLGFSDSQGQALMRLAHLIDADVEPFEAVRPVLRPIAGTPELDIEQPDLKILQAQIEYLERAVATERWQGVDSDFTLTQSGGSAIPLPATSETQFGYGAVASLNVRMPLQIVTYQRAEQSRLRSQIVGLRTEYTRRSQELDIEFRSAVNRYQRLGQQINFQRARLDAARESVRERYLRLNALDEDVLEKYIQAVSAYYRVAVDYVDAETEQWKAHVRLRQFVSSLSAGEGERNYPDAELTRLLDPLQRSREALGGRPIAGKGRLSVASLSDAPPLAIPASVSQRFAVYVWNSHAVLAQPGFWKQSEAFKVGRVLLSLDGQQIKSVASDSKPLRLFLEKAHRRGVKVELLLGDPNWILPEGRDGLWQIVAALKDADFDGLHLDIEPDQLESGISGQERLNAFLETIRQAKKRSPWPVGISIHPRYLSEESSVGLCVPCQLEKAGVREVAVMFYSINTRKIVATLKPVMQKHPELTFSLAQSVERKLEPDTSYAHQPRRKFAESMRQLDEQLQAPNFGGLVIQSWQDWNEYMHENPL
jgi:hypothetical protein